ncbi:10236_t:CDS:2, partial [Dentiscutata erythropus]
QSTKWESYFPNEIYADFMKLIIDNNLSNTVGDAIIKIFNNHTNRIDEPLLSSTQQEKYQIATKQIFHQAIAKILKPLYSQYEKEANMCCLTYSSSQSQWP